MEYAVSFFFCHSKQKKIGVSPLVGCGTALGKKFIKVPEKPKDNGGMENTLTKEE